MFQGRQDSELGQIPMDLLLVSVVSDVVDHQSGSIYPCLYYASCPGI